MIEPFAFALLGNGPIQNTEPPCQNAQSDTRNDRDTQHEQHDSTERQPQPWQSLLHWSIVLPDMSTDIQSTVTGLSARLLRRGTARVERSTSEPPLRSTRNLKAHFHSNPMAASDMLRRVLWISKPVEWEAACRQACSAGNWAGFCEEWERYVALASPCQHQALRTPSKGS